MADDEGKKVECPPGAPAWMCTFADLMSLLMCFFVLLLSFSVMDAQKYKQVAGSMRDAFGVQRELRVTKSLRGQQMVSTEFPSVPLQVQIQITKAFGEEIESGMVEAEYGADGLILRVKDELAFDSGRHQIKKRFLPFLDKLGRLIAKMDLAVKVSGHTDNVPVKKGVGSYRTNWGLSSARSVEVVEYWIRRFKVPPSRLSAQGFAEGHPLASNDSTAGRARNRRVEFKIRPANPHMVVPGINVDVGAD